jgi:hypothetical protein
MGKLVRKNLVMDDDKVKELARLRGTSESQAVRGAVAFVLAAEEVRAALQHLHEIGGIDDVFGKLADDSDS